jgi:hypothetical protein
VVSRETSKLKYYRPSDITSTRISIIYPSGKIIAHDSRYMYKKTKMTKQDLAIKLRKMYDKDED